MRLRSGKILNMANGNRQQRNNAEASHNAVSQAVVTSTVVETVVS